MKYLSLLMLVVCMSAFANASGSVPVEKEKKEKRRIHSKHDDPHEMVQSEVFMS